jgi:hypothetical protein
MLGVIPCLRITCPFLHVCVQTEAHFDARCQELRHEVDSLLQDYKTRIAAEAKEQVIARVARLMTVG